MAGHQLPLMSLFVPLYMVRCMCTWKQTLEVWPALLVAGGSFAVFQYFFATSHLWIKGLVLYPMTDIGGGIFSLVVTAVFLRFWKPKNEWHFDKPVSLPDTHAEAKPAAHVRMNGEAAARCSTQAKPAREADPVDRAHDCRRLDAVRADVGRPDADRPGSAARAGGPGQPFRWIGPMQTNYLIPIPFLHEEVERDPFLPAEGKQAEKERAFFNFAWLTAPGTAVFLCGSCLDGTAAHDRGNRSAPSSSAPAFR